MWLWWWWWSEEEEREEEGSRRVGVWGENGELFNFRSNDRSRKRCWSCDCQGDSVVWGGCGGGGGGANTVCCLFERYVDCVCDCVLLVLLLLLVVVPGTPPSLFGGREVFAAGPGLSPGVACGIICPISWSILFFGDS